MNISLEITEYQYIKSTEFPITIKINNMLSKFETYNMMNIERLKELQQQLNNINIQINDFLNKENK